MTRNAHQAARELIALGESLSDTQQVWLRTHVNECEVCRQYAERAEQLVRGLHSVPMAADSRLVQATQMRVRMRARELQMRRERFVFVALSCALVAISSALTTMLIWRGFEWVGRWSQMPNPIWQVGFALFWIAPTLAAALLFLAHGTHLSGSARGGSFRG
jgi:predicted anti-sigma-YlaC factor YlaD